MMKTKEVARQLGVSQTTIRRWMTLLPSAPAKDAFGSFLFEERDLGHLRDIQNQIEAGKGMSEITLAVQREAAVASSLPQLEVEPASALPPEYEFDPAMQQLINEITSSAVPTEELTPDASAAIVVPLEPAQPESMPELIPEQLEPITNEVRERLQRLEQALAQKADDVVSVQLLQHREELEELRRTVSQLAAAVEQLQMPLQMVAAAGWDSTNKLAPIPIKQRPKKRSFLRQLFFFI
ncbi:MerR family transcriptional regulator [Paenibacillus methanolicus]|uniref:MerR-like DNA binding protein n=1 Tax=Paenibacillus methanolicus TaxID=582686 RepID=A0A5S5BUG6_9BACL|nr:MerR family transcriptional regulator [Paenibacillus methanolicus]TYP70821.1 MerR-like DNA binding protein [Paenibacillus methanolicus]